ncbi:MAG: nitrate reductase cytochrome c-type subunit; periplasmic nitrate reductase electron transfer subunit [Epsilonproteobacteria bacterium]|nr:nitrate reductase cytochrome c-type subunit; periplasmic nitrate reductase electron transfer subunit [Campylobacterota bacterium]
MKKLLMISSVVALALVGCSNTTSSSTNSVSNKTVKVTGIRQSSLNAGSENLPSLEYHAPAPTPGQVKPFKKSFVTAPPMIPHSVNGMVPIKVGKNQCLMCHMPSTAKSMGITPMPKDHFIDNFEGDKKLPKVAGSRYFCTTCHTPQAKVDPVVENKFESLKTW